MCVCVCDRVMMACLVANNKDTKDTKRRFRKDEQMMRCVVSKHFSRVRVPDLGYEPLKSASKRLISSFVHPSEIFVWGNAREYG